MNKGIKPKLRFPEFQDAPEWHNAPLREVYSFKVTNSFSRDQLNYANGSVKNIHYGDIHTKFSTLFDISKEIVPYINPSESIEKIQLECYCTEGDMIFADASEDLNDVGKSIEIVHLNNEKLLSGMHTLLARQITPKLAIGFGGYLFKSNGIREQIKKEAQGAKVFGVSSGRLSNIKIYFPHHKAEQQKIADCLTSLDDLIAAHAQKLSALKSYKKGLMQALFPAAGESLPKLRFPEFQDAGEWEKKQLNNISPSIFDGTHQTPTYIAEGVPFYSVENIISGNKNKFISRDDYIATTRKNKPEKGDILLTRIGKIGFSLVVDWDHDFSVYVTLAVIKQSKSFNSHYLHYFIQSDRCQSEILNKSLLNAVPPKINMDSLREINILLPKPLEQQKIADCLSSLDEQIAAQSQKLEALKVHKKGLMQGLFPSVEEGQG